ncbi:MAG TPA: hypothetical protein VJI68_01250 [Candidatus Nanoarchaeia archaeon]|nr:hypothetical protein [Candidatus Nanoarchaeia archaeon]
MKEVIKETKGKKCDYCDEIAMFKILQEGLYEYLCITCVKDTEQAKKEINN